MRNLCNFAALTIALAGLTAVPASAAKQGTPAKSAEAPRPLDQQEPSAVDVITTPAGDLNLRKSEIPPLLVAAQAKPYDLKGLRTCSTINGTVQKFNAVLGDDVDTTEQAGRKISAGRVAQAAVGSFIPFRGLIREISGANGHERALDAAVQAGVARRSFLKGYGFARGCGPALKRAMAADAAARAAADEAAKTMDKTKDK